MWPHFEAVANRSAVIADAIKADPNVDLSQFQTTGKVKAQSRKRKPVEATKMPAHMKTAQAEPAKKAEPPK